MGKISSWILLFAAVVAAFPIGDVYAAQFTCPVGFSAEQLLYPIKPKESLHEVARRFRLGFNSIANANPAVDPFIPKTGTLVTVPTVWVMPDVPQQADIVINLPEMRLYLLSEQNGWVRSFPLGIGDEGADTPVGSFTIVQKIVQPSWFVPASIRKEKPYLPAVVPPGPDNPMGSHALRLSKKNILIHGTDRPWGIGKRTSHGCLRMYPEDIAELFDHVRKGMKVRIVDQAVKAAVTGERVYIEVHRYDGRDYRKEALMVLGRKKMLERVDVSKLLHALQAKSGIPTDISR